MTLPRMAAGTAAQNRSDSNSSQRNAAELEVMLNGAMNSAYGAGNYDVSRKC